MNGSNRAQRCSCGRKMVEKFLFTSSYWECEDGPRCDAPDYSPITFKGLIDSPPTNLSKESWKYLAYMDGTYLIQNGGCMDIIERLNK